MKKRATLVILTGLTWACLGSMTFAQDDVYCLTNQGYHLTLEEAKHLEEQLTENPNDVASRTILLAYYQMRQYRDQHAQETRNRHILWLIRHSPRAAVLHIPEGTLNAGADPDAFHSGKTAWITHLEEQPSDLAILENAANFFQQWDRKRSRQILQRAQSLDPRNPKWPRAIGLTYNLDLHRYMRPKYADQQSAKIAVARNALAAFETAYGLGDDCERTELLTYLSQVAFEANQLQKARSFAERMLTQTSGCPCSDGQSLHSGHIILGRLALRNGDIDQAKQHLLAAGRTPGSPGLNSFGPNMRLAKELILQGEKEVVLDYFALCSRFWKREDRLAEWSALVEAGLMPEFGANEYY